MQLRLHDREIVLVHDLLRVAAQEFGLRIAEDVLAGGGDVGALEVAVEQRDHVGRVVRQQPVPLLADVQRTQRLGELAVADAELPPHAVEGEREDAEFAGRPRHARPRGQVAGPESLGRITECGDRAQQDGARGGPGGHQDHDGDEEREADGEIEPPVGVPDQGPVRHGRGDQQRVVADLDRREADHAGHAGVIRDGRRSGGGALAERRGQRLRDAGRHRRPGFALGRGGQHRGVGRVDDQPDRPGALRRAHEQARDAVEGQRGGDDAGRRVAGHRDGDDDAGLALEPADYQARGDGGPVPRERLAEIRTIGQGDAGGDPLAEAADDAGAIEHGDAIDLRVGTGDARQGRLAARFEHADRGEVAEDPQGVARLGDDARLFPGKQPRHVAQVHFRRLDRLHPADDRPPDEQEKHGNRCESDQERDAGPQAVVFQVRERRT